METKKAVKILIHDEQKISIIQKKFGALFPFLKIEFFAKPHKQFGGSPKKSIKSNALEIGDCRTIRAKGYLIISPNMTVNELEQQFMSKYGLSAQVFRKSGSVWLETTVTDGWTLQKQNSEGEDLSRLKNEKLEPQEYDWD